MLAAHGFSRSISLLAMIPLLMIVWELPLCQAADTRPSERLTAESETEKEARDTHNTLSHMLKQIEKLEDIISTQVADSLAHEKQLRRMIDTTKDKEELSILKASLAKWQQLRLDLASKLEALEEDKKAIIDQMAMLESHFKKEPAAN